MKTIRLPLILSISLLCCACSATAVDNWRSASGSDLRNSSGDCWRSASWTAATAAPGCDGIMNTETEKVAVLSIESTPAVQEKAAPAQAIQIVTLNADVNFETGKSTLTPAAKKVVNEIVVRIFEHSDHVVEINLVGHTDEVGDYTANDKLSLARAKEVKAYFVLKGISHGSIDVHGAGETYPLEYNGTASGRAANRRVDITISLDRS